MTLTPGEVWILCLILPFVAGPFWLMSYGSDLQHRHGRPGLLTAFNGTLTLIGIGAWLYPFFK